MTELISEKPCGHPHHPEDGNLGHIPEGGPVRAERAVDVKAHLTNPAWFVGKYCKLGFPEPHNTRKEYMWVLADSFNPQTKELEGPLKNTPVRIPGLCHGAVIAFTADEVIDVYEE
jgi:hypothetical protein